MRKIIILLGLSIATSSISSAKTLSETEIFYRCYAHITGKRVKRTHSLLQDIKKGIVSGTDACLKVLDKAKLQSNGEIKNIQDEEAKAVLSSMTKAHMTFFEKRALIGANVNYTRVEQDIYDEQAPALFYTKALLNDSYNITDVLTGKKDLQGIRSERSPASVGYSSNINKNKFTYNTHKKDSSKKFIIKPWNVSFVEVGDLIGLKEARTLSKPEFLGTDKDILSSLGGGLLGGKSYLKRALPIGNIKASDGANSMNRAWAQTVLKDFLCKPLPAVRLTDGTAYIRSEADAVFRKSEGCISCHVTMDQLAAGGRGLRVAPITIGQSTAANPQIRYPYHLEKTVNGGDLWPAKADKNYFRKSPLGVLYYRSYTGDLIRKPFKNMDELGKNMLETDDFYACVAKKYYHHFTGVSVSLADINDPFSPLQLNEQELFHRNEVIKLGEGLRKNKSTYGLVKTILKSKVYKKEGFTLLGGD